MIVGTKSILNDISNALSNFDIEEEIQLSYSQIDEVDIQCNNLVKFSSNIEIEKIKKLIITKLLKNILVENVSFAKNNFLNIKLSNEYLKKHLIINLDKLNAKKTSIIIDYK